MKGITSPTAATHGIMCPEPTCCTRTDGGGTCGGAENTVPNVTRAWNDVTGPRCRGGAVRGPQASHEPGDGSGEEVLVVEADVARHGGVLLPEGLRHALELGAHLDETVQLDAGSPARRGEASHQRLGELRTQVVAHLSEAWRTEQTQQGPERSFQA